MLDEAKVLDICRNHKPAADLICGLLKLIVEWDNCIDRDKPVDEIATNNAVMWAMFSLHDNPFYREHEKAIRAAIFSGVTSWVLANEFEKTNSKRLLERSYMMRSSFFDLAGTIAGLAVGSEAQFDMVRYFRSLDNPDTLSSYLAEHYTP